VSFLRSLAEHIESGELEVDRLPELSDEELIAELTAVKGLGVWTVHMFMIFELRRPDVLATGDLGVRRAAERAYGLPDLPAADELERMAEPWRPHRSAACLLLWHSLRNAPA
jgi:DNA-3-methyladenine glycosylase II